MSFTAPKPATLEDALCIVGASPCAEARAGIKPKHDGNCMTWGLSPRVAGPVRLFSILFGGFNVIIRFVPATTLCLEMPTNDPFARVVMCAVSSPGKVFKMSLMGTHFQAVTLHGDPSRDPFQGHPATPTEAEGAVPLPCLPDDLFDDVFESGRRHEGAIESSFPRWPHGHKAPAKKILSTDASPAPVDHTSSDMPPPKSRRSAPGQRSHKRRTPCGPDASGDRVVPQLGNQSARWTTRDGVKRSTDEVSGADRFSEYSSESLESLPDASFSSILGTDYLSQESYLFATPSSDPPCGPQTDSQ